MYIFTYLMCLYLRCRRQWFRRGSSVRSYKTNHGYEQEGDQAWKHYYICFVWLTGGG